MNDVIFAGLNDKQREAVEVLSGPLLILAGAGSGKTKTLTHRIANLIAHGTPGNEMLAVTFTNKAAVEMQSRIETLLRSAGSFRMPSVGTFHATCVRILRQDIESLPTNLTKNFVIFDSDDSKKLIKMILKDLGFDEKEIKHRAVASHISSAKNQLMTPSDYIEDEEDNRFTVAVKKVFPAYQKRLEEHNALDFDDLLQKTVQLFEQCPEVLAKYRARWSHLMVDEYQDTNFAQYRLVRLLSDEHKNLCVIGDDHQSIYRFRGADYTNILNFENDFPEATVIKLEQNYRSSANILANANALIGHNETGRKKNLWTESEPGEPMKVLEVFNEREEGNIIAQSIQDGVRAGDRYADFSILYRMNAQSRSIEEALMRNQIPYQIIGGTRFFDRKEIKDVIAYLRLIFNPRDDVSFLRIINVPTRKLGVATLQTVKDFASNYSMSLFEILSNVEDIESLAASKKQSLRDFHDLIRGFQKVAEDNPISILLDKVIEQTNFLKHLDDGAAEGESRQQNVRELFSVAARYDAADNPLADFLEGVALISDLDSMTDKSDTVTLMTVHASKGLEFPNVFLPGWEEGIFPSSSAQFSFDDLEEERRLGYVAITRAEKNCTITYAKQRTLFGQTNYSAPSKFLAELDEECIERIIQAPTNRFGSPRKKPNFYSPKNSSSSPQKLKSNKPWFAMKQPQSKQEAVFGVAENATDYSISDKVEHSEWGTGTIIQISGDILTIAFPGIGMKKIVASISPIEKV